MTLRATGATLGGPEPAVPTRSRLPVSRRTIPLALVAAVVVTCAFASPASAAKPTKSSGCPTAPDLGKVFEPVDGDLADYYLAPQGDFERSAWSGGERVTGDATALVGSVTDARSMRLGGRGSVAISPSVCIGLSHPTMRFFVQRQVGSLALPLGVSVRYTGDDRRTYETPIAQIAPVTSGVWTPTPPTPLIANLLPAVQAVGTAPTDPTLATGTVRFVFTAPAGTSWLVDDVYVDPYSRG